MKNKPKDLRKILVTLILAAVVGVIYLVSIYLAYSTYQDTRLIDPLAEMKSLFPLYYIALFLTAILALGCFVYRIENKYVHILLLSIISLMLWFTPYYLAGFVRLPDSPWHVGVAMHMPQVLEGSYLFFVKYAQSFPGSFVYHYSFLRVLGLEPTTYISVLFPFLCLLLFVLLCYSLVSQLFNRRVAFLSLLIAIPGLHYIEIHPSPHAIGSLLLLTALLLLAHRGITPTVLALMVIAAMLISHPITPILLFIFLAAALATSLFHRIGRGKVVALATILVAGFLAWFLWYWSPSAGFSGLYQQIIPTDPEVGQTFLVGTPFIYGGIYNLNKAIYLIYAVVAAVGIIYLLVKTYARRKSFRDFLSELGGLDKGQALMLFSLPLLLLLSLLLAERNPVLIERSLTFIVLAVSCLIASIVSRLHCQGSGKKFLSLALTAGLCFLVLSYPVVAYSIDAYSSFPRSEQAGLEFLARNVSLEDNILLTTGENQLALYTQAAYRPAMCLSLLELPPIPRGAKLPPNVVAFRSTGYYYAAMRFDLSFDDNRFIRYLRAVENSKKYDKLYSSPTFQVYSKKE